ncbi:hypothetical protein [Fibrobacter sp. UWH9]|uniref:hypothetical protein n=1 Tax=Fibrobacter sp. UWH9 TaxID=1896213 RepID=UPI001114A488|nr:hypothetical protein [Fibrobacter sp. UWH9]
MTKESAIGNGGKTFTCAPLEGCAKTETQTKQKTTKKSLKPVENFKITPEILPYGDFEGKFRKNKPHFKVLFM